MSGYYTDTQTRMAEIDPNLFNTWLVREGMDALCYQLNGFPTYQDGSKGNCQGSNTPAPAFGLSTRSRGDWEYENLHYGNYPWVMPKGQLAIPESVYEPPSLLRGYEFGSGKAKYGRYRNGRKVSVKKTIKGRATRKRPVRKSRRRVIRRK